MSVAEDLLAQARFLASKEKRRPFQASLRRSVSTSYYALFHFIGEETSKLLVGTSATNKPLRNFARRAIAHSRLKDVCSQFIKNTPRAVVLREFWQAGYDPMAIVGDPEFAIICENFSRLQDKRHEADYNFARNFSRQDAFDACDQAEAAMAAWKRLKSSKPDALKLFATAILLWPGLSGR